MNVKQALSTLITIAALGGAVSLIGITRAQADEEQFRVRRGFEIAPVPLNLRGKDRELVGLGSYLVNAVASCNMCHSAGTSTEYTAGGNPYFKGNEPNIVNQATYLGGGRVFASQVAGATPAIVSRNLTPDKTGRPVGGHTFEEFRLILQTGADLDQVHPNCADPTVTASSTCFPAKYPYDGDKLQVMPWPELHHLSERDLRAIYEYLRAIPCVSGPASGVLHNDCT